MAETVRPPTNEERSAAWAAATATPDVDPVELLPELTPTEAALGDVIGELVDIAATGNRAQRRQAERGLRRLGL